METRLYVRNARDVSTAVVIRTHVLTKRGFSEKAASFQLPPASEAVSKLVLWGFAHLFAAKLCFADYRPCSLGGHAAASEPSGFQPRNYGVENGGAAARNEGSGAEKRSFSARRANLSKNRDFC